MKPTRSTTIKLTTTAASLTVAENSAPTAIKIAAPADSKYSSSQLTVTVTGLPSDGTVYLSDGKTVVTNGEALTVAQLTGLTFSPTTGEFSQSSSFNYTVTDPSGTKAAGTATLAIGGQVTTPPVTSAASLTVAENAAATAIGIAAPTDPNYSAAQLTVTVNGLPSDGMVYLADGTTAVTNGETLTVAQLMGLTFKPTTGMVSQSSTFSYTVADPMGQSATGNATLAIAAPASGGIVFNNTFTANVTSAYKNDILAAEAQISSLFSNPITLNLTFDAQAMGTSAFSAENSWPAFVNVSYAQLKSALTSHAFSSYAASAVAALPSSDPNPAGGNDWALPEAYARMLGLSSSTYSADDTITLNTSYGWSYGQDVINTIEHELSEGAMGRVGGLGDQNGVWSVMDLFRYSAAGLPDYTDGRDGQATYFSYNGGSTLSSLSFNNQYSGLTRVNSYDTADFNQLDVFGEASLGETFSLSQTDIEILDVLGWNPSATSAASSVASASTTTTGGVGGGDLSQTGLLGSYIASMFPTSSDGHTGMLISEATQGSQAVSLAHPQA